MEKFLEDFPFRCILSLKPLIDYLDKTSLKGKGERLTQPGKIAVVYSHPEEAQEMLRHMDFLRSEGYLTGDVENLELEQLPGVKGLRALRASVNFDSEALSERVKPMAG